MEGHAQPTDTCSAQIVGSRLRIPQVTPADSGECVCHVSNGAGSQETSLIVTIQAVTPPTVSTAEGRVREAAECQGEAVRSWLLVTAV